VYVLQQLTADDLKEIRVVAVGDRSCSRRSRFGWSDAFPSVSTAPSPMDLALVSGPAFRLRNGVSLGAKFHGELRTARRPIEERKLAVPVLRSTLDS
jgi:hypothetical protein